MRKSTEFVCFGIKYKTTQFAAVHGFDLFKRLDGVHPTELLADTFALDADKWLPLSDGGNINGYVKDLAGVLSPREVLTCLCAAVSEYSFGFLAGWKAVRVPTRFQSGADPVEAKGMDPVVAHLFSTGVPLREMEEYYSLEDVFNMFDASVAKSVNSALAEEASRREAANR